MTRRELIEELRSRGIDKIWGRGLTTRSKSELIEYLNHVDSGDGARHLSYSQLSDYMICGLRYYFKRVDPKAPKFPLSSRMHLGGCYHKGLAEGLEEKMLSGSQPAESLMTDRFIEAYQNPEGEVDWTDDKQYLETQGVELVRLYRQVLIPRLTPRAVEESFTVSFSNREFTLLTIPDLEAETDMKTIHVIDHKTASKTPTREEAVSNDQLTAYALAHKAKEGTLPDRVAIHKAVLLKKEPKSADVYHACKFTDKGFVGIAPLEDVRTEKHIQRYLKTMELQTRLLAQGIYMPAKPGFWPCTPGACDFWEYCHENF